MHKIRFSRYVFEIRREKTMKKTLKHLFSAAICAIMLFACVFPNFAAADTELSSVDAEKLEAFFAQSAGDGRHNFDHPDYAGGVYGSYTVSNFRKVPVSALRTVSSVGSTLTPMQWEAFCALPRFGIFAPASAAFSICPEHR